MAHPWFMLFHLASLHISSNLFLTPSMAAPTYLDSICSDETTFLPNSSYENNLKKLFLSLSSSANTNTNNFYSTVAGDKAHNNTVYGLYLCRGGLNLTSCKGCVAAATVDLLQSYCRSKKVAVIWYSECMVRYSNESIFEKMEKSPKLIISNSKKITRNQQEFTEFFWKMMNELVVQVASDNSGKRFAVKSINFTDSQVLHMSGQCTPDLTISECTSCLKIGIRLLAIRTSGSVFLPSCNVVYKLIVSTGTRQTGDRHQLLLKVIVVTVLPIASISMGLLGLCLIIRKAKNYNVAVEKADEDMLSIESLRYDMATLQTATNYFSDDNIVAQGFFGCIYKGRLPGGRKVLVKRLPRRYEQNVQEFKEEVLAHAKLQHRNLVELIGFCLEGEERLVVHEHVPNPNLHYFLTDPQRREQLDWDTRFSIICGIARGMLYLDLDSRLIIIHSDLRPANILLDANMNAKISHFGLSIISDKNGSDKKTDTLLGSFGYMSDEETLHKEFSVKSNVVCFGVLLLAIISSERYSNLNSIFQHNFAEDLLIQAWKKWKEGTPLDFVDPTLRDPCLSEEVLRCMHLGLLCIQGSPDDRPTMASVVFMLLQSSTVTLMQPEEPAFFFSSEEKAESSICRQAANITAHTVNTTSMSELQPR